ncbi:MAG: type I methionyl aminopeptidase, partial [Propionibacterium sp.]|nr:type I methionyl aminopeptidase [Propionibacterium sp.]
MSIVTPHTITPVRPVPNSIPRPEYAWKDAPQPYQGSHVQSDDVIERMRVAGRIASQAMHEA